MQTNIIKLFAAYVFKVVYMYKASCWDCQDFYVSKTKRRLYDRKTEHFKAITSNGHSSAIAEHLTSLTSTGHNLKWDHFDISSRENQIPIVKSRRLFLLWI